MSDPAPQAPERLDALLEKARQAGASDLHLDPRGQDLVARARVDGVFITLDEMSGPLAKELRNRVKVLARLVMHREDIPQEGVFKAEREGSSMQVRVSILPTILGEKVALRLLLKDGGLQDLAGLGFEAGVQRSLEAAAQYRDGLVLVCGPSGSGKTTTIYAMLRSILAVRPDRVNVLSIEDPVEVLVPGVNQVPLNAFAGLDYAQAARAALRQDPEVLAVSEIRDPATAEAVLRASFTGHLVLSSLHCARAAEAPRRLADLGVQPAVLAGALRGALAQRLVRVFCRDCAGKGCLVCKGSGWRGRVVLGEWLDLTGPEANSIVRKGGPVEELMEKAPLVPAGGLKEAGLRLLGEKRSTERELQLAGVI